MDEPSTPTTINARLLLLPYALALITTMLIIQLVIGFTGGGIGTLAGILTALVAVGIAVWLWFNYRRLTHVRFGIAIAHAIAFTTVTTSFNLHGLIRTITLGSDAGTEAAAHNLVATPWFGATLVMSALWGLGLLIHLIGIVLGRGWED